MLTKLEEWIKALGVQLMLLMFALMQTGRSGLTKSFLLWFWK
jgi:hypothetical protein